MSEPSSDEIITRAKDPKWWERQAEYLMAGGQAVIEKSNETFKTSLKESDIEKRFEIIASPEMWMTLAGVMLLGFSLENLLKGLIVSTNENSVWEENNKLKTEWGKNKGHNLRWLAEKANLSISKEESEFLDFLTKVTVWGGRYPVPKSVEELGMEWNEESHKLLLALYGRAKAIR